MAQQQVKTSIDKIKSKKQEQETVAQKETKSEKVMIKKGKFKIFFDKRFETNRGFICRIDMKPLLKENSIALMAKETAMTYEKAHELLGHAGETIVKATANMYGWNITQQIEKCDSCPVAKAKQKILKKIASEVDQVKKVGELMCSDISSTAGTSFGGSKFWLLVVDHATKMKWSFFIKQKSNQSKILLKLAF
jgi:predicted component of viral defense system (DUF524 family)